MGPTIEWTDYESPNSISEITIQGEDFSYISEQFVESDLVNRIEGADNVEDIGEIIDYARNVRERTAGDWSPPKPSSDAYVWRYLNFTQLLSILEQNQIWFTRVDQFEDPYEGTIPKQNVLAEVEDIKGEFCIDSDVAKRIHRLSTGNLNLSVTSAYVNCWNVNENQSAALWEQYVNSPEGVAIRTTENRLSNAIKDDDRELTYGNVEYIDYDEDTIAEGDLPAIYHKRKSFKHENEYRISHISDDGDIGPGFYADVNKDLLIDRIVISPIAPGWFSNLVNLVLDRYDLDCELKKSDLYSDPDVAVE